MSEPPPSDVGAQEARELAEQVLSGRAYVEAARPPSLQERLFQWIADRIGDLFNALSTSGGRGLFAWVIVGVFALLIAFLISRLIRNFDPLPPQPKRPSATIDIIGDQSASEWLQQALDAEAAGDWRSAVRCRHRSLVAQLLADGVITARAGLTAGEIHQMVAAARPQADAPMQEATWLFKDSWYGWIDADASTSRRFAALAAEVVVIVEHEPAAVPVAAATVGATP